MLEEQLLASANAWLAQDPDPVTRAELQQLIDSNDIAGLHSRFDARLEFGTAGLRGELGAGPNRMNRVLVAQAALGLANYLLKNFEKPSVVIGFDGRINSDVFARDSAEIMAGAGIEVLLFDNYVPTPVLAFAVKHRDASAGVMVTASHNPPRDNGYKVYLGGDNDGSQIISPTDSHIAAEIANVAAQTSFEQMQRSQKLEVGGGDVRTAYVSATASLVQIGETKPEIVFTAMHGVGYETLSEVFKAASLQLPLVVPQQNEPDGNFPTVSFPNPEEPGAMDLAFALAAETNPDVVIANDPDADRMAVGVANGGWHRLSGDQIGLVLGDWAAARAQQQNRNGNLACSIVSSSALGKVAEHYGLGYVETLTGFKWITKVPNLIFGFEEALGYCVDPEHTPDKDGISASLVMASIVADLKTKNRTLEDHLQLLAQKYGHFNTSQISIRVTDLSIIKNAMIALRANPPAKLAGLDCKTTDLKNATAKLPATDALRFDLSDGSRVIVRPSGTEPKLKCYLQTVGDNEESAVERMQALRNAMMQLLPSD